MEFKQAVKEEPPEDLDLIIDDSAEPEPEDEDEPPAEVKEEPPEEQTNCLTRHQNLVLDKNETPQQMNSPTEDSPAPHEDEAGQPQTEAQEEPQMEHFLVIKPKWVKSVELTKFDSESRGASRMYQTFQISPQQTCKLVSDFDKPNQVSSFESSLAKVKEEPPEEFVLFLPQPPDDDSSAPEEEDEVEPQAKVKEEPQEEWLLELLPPPRDQSRQAKSRQRTKTKKKNFCAICDVKFSRKLLFNRHQNEIHGVVFKCDKCSYEGKNEHNLVEHRRTHNKSLSCETCGKKFALAQPLNLHQMHHRHGIYATAPAETFDCNECEKLFSTPAGLKLHQKGVHDEKEVKCEKCDKICKNRFMLLKHIQSHAKIECSICNKRFSKKYLPRHLRLHLADSSAQQKQNEDIEPHVDVKEEPKEDNLLELLPKPPTSNQSREARTRQPPKKQSKVGFTNKKYLQEPSKSKAIHICAFCGVEFSRKLLLERHQYELHGAGFQCDKCSFRTKLKISMRIHMGTHNKSFKCETCEKKFAKRISLKSHQMHNKHGIYKNAPEEIFACGKCNKTFSTPAGLGQHLRKLHDEVEVKCEKCDKICRNRITLRHHRRTHEIIECSICRRIIPKSSLAHHLHSHRRPL